MKLKQIFRWVHLEWFKLSMLLLLAFIAWQTMQIKESVREIEDGIEVEIVDSVDTHGLFPSLPKLPKM